MPQESEFKRWVEMKGIVDTLFFSAPMLDFSCEPCVFSFVIFFLKELTNTISHRGQLNIFQKLSQQSIDYF